MLYNDKYFYKMIDKTDFDIVYLTGMNNNAIISKYVLVYYQDKDNNVKSRKYYDLSDSEENVLVKYYIEEIDNKLSPFDNEYLISKYYDIKGIGYIHEFYPIDNSFEYQLDNEKVKEKIENYDKSWLDFKIEEINFFENK